MNINIFNFFVNTISKKEFENKRIIEIGSKDINGSIRPLIQKFLNPKNYIGIDIKKGKGVDLICPAEKLVEHFGKESFDIVIATEILEHVKNWKVVIQNIKGILKQGGYLYITTRSKGFPYHGYPYDFWRYEVEDMKNIFSDFKIINLEKEPGENGVFLKASKQKIYKYVNLSNLNLYSMVLGKKVIFIPDNKSMPFSRKIKIVIYKYLVSFKYLVKRLIKFY